MSSQWSEVSSERFSKIIRYSTIDLFEAPGLVALREKVNLSRVQRMLSVGSGNGRFDLALMKRYSMTVDFIEPSQLLRSELTKNLEMHEGPGHAGRVFEGGFEDYVSETNYDLILAIHSFYYVKNPIEAVQKALGLLNPAGELVIILHMDDSLGAVFGKELNKNPIHSGITADWMLEHLNTPCQSSVLEALLPCKEIIEGKDLSRRGREVASFYAQRDWDQFSADEKRQARRLAERCSDGQMIKERYGILHFKRGHQ